MSHSIADLHALSDEEVIALHDEQARVTSVGTAYWMDEIERRSRERATAANIELARASQTLANRSYWLTVASTVLSAIATVIAIVALFKS
jgi:hypothetical protein